METQQLEVYSAEIQRNTKAPFWRIQLFDIDDNHFDTEEFENRNEMAEFVGILRVLNREFVLKHA